MLLILTAVGSLDVKFRTFNQTGLLCVTVEEQWNLDSVYVLCCFSPLCTKTTKLLGSSHGCHTVIFDGREL